MAYSVTPLYTFISTGEKTAMYTLRVMETVNSLNGLGQRITYLDSTYVQNLSTDRQGASDKAQSLSAMMNIPFRDNADFDLNEIKRRKATEVQAERDARENAKREYLQLEAEKFAAEVEGGFMVIGKHIGKTPAEIISGGDEDYVAYCAGQYQQDAEQGSWAVNCKVCAEYLEKNPLAVSAYLGSVGGKLQVELRIVKRVSCNGRFFTRLYVGKDAQGNIVKFFSTAKAFQEVYEGDTIVVEGNVKVHEKDYYMQGNPCTTLINRPKVVK